MRTRDRQWVILVAVAAAALGGAGCQGTSHKPNPGQGPDPGPADTPDAAVVSGPDAAAPDLVRRETPPPAPPNGPIAPWAAKDIGAVGMQREEVRSSPGLMTVRAGGMEVGGTADSFQYVSQRVRGDFDLLGRVRSLQLVDPETKAGLMVRANDTEPGAANAFLAVLADPAKGGLLQYRAAAGAPTTFGATDTGVRAGQWLRLTRKGRTLTAQRSSNRLAWTKVGSVDLDLPLEVSVGVAVAARSAMAATTAEIDGLRLSNFDTQLATREWILDEMGAMGGSVVWNGTALAVSALGDTPSLLSESGAFAYQTASGNQALTVRVASLAHKDPAARLGLMIREGPPIAFQRTQPAVILSVTPGMGVQFQSRAFNNLMATLAPVKDGVKAPIWLRLERTEDPGPPLTSRFTGSYSDDGRTWTAVGSVTFALPEPYLLGLIASSNGSTTPVTATLTDVAVTVPTAPVAPPPPPPDAGRPDATGDGR
jgi:regulation of enolase protein 1 (concanavalin A-like superfamily)